MPIFIFESAITISMLLNNILNTFNTWTIFYFLFDKL